MKSRKTLKGFQFAGFDDNDEPIIKDQRGNALTAQQGPPPGEHVLTMEIYQDNPTWVCVGGKCYRVG